MPAHGGAVAQMGERCNRTAEVRGSIPLGSTTSHLHQSHWHHAAGRKGRLGHDVQTTHNARLKAIALKDVLVIELKCLDDFDLGPAGMRQTG
jgi:hypothetical protein